MGDFTIDDDWVREHGSFVRSLSRSILREEFRDDAEQEAWLSALRRPPRENPGAWLRSVATRFAGRFQRERVRRVRREQAAARPEALPSTASLTEKAEILRLVGEVVAELREPYRAAVLLRYYEELPPRDIAQRLDLPVATVLSRIQRGLRQVREELGRRSRGHVNRWSDTLALAIGLPAPGVIPASRPLIHLGVVSMKTKFWIGVAVVLAVVSAVGIREWTGPSTNRAAGTVVADSAARGEERAVLEEEPAAEAARAPVTGVESSAATLTSLVVRGRVVEPGGGGVRAAEVFAGPGPDELRPIGLAGETGEFALDLEPADRVLCAQAAGWAPTPLFRVPASLEQVVVLRLPVRGTRLSVRVVDSRGLPVAGASILAGREHERAHRFADGTLAPTLPVLTQPTDEAGVARFEGLALGWIRVTATHPDFAPRTVFATLQPDELNRVDVELEEGFFVEGTITDSYGQPVAGAVLTRGSSPYRSAVTDIDGIYRFGPIDAGKVVATGPLGRRVEKRLGGRAGDVVPWSPVLDDASLLSGIVLDSEGRGRAGWWVTANHDTWPGWSRGAPTDAGGRFEIHGCPEGLLRVEARPREAAPLPVHVEHDVLAAEGELRIVTRDVVGASVRAWLSLPAGAEPELRLQHVTTSQRQRLTGGDGVRLELRDGVFEQADVPPGSYRIVALGPPYGWLKVAELEVGVNDVDLGDLELPQSGKLITTLRRRPGAPSTVASFLLENQREFVTLLDIDGEFPAELDLAPGRYVLQVEVTPGPQAEYAFEIRPGGRAELDVDLGSSCIHRVLVEYRSGRRPTGPLALMVRQLDVDQTVMDGDVTYRSGVGWTHDLELEPGRFEFVARTPEGLEARGVYNLFTSSPGRAIELVVDDSQAR